MNILVDKEGIPYIAGLGNAYITPRSPSRAVEGGTKTNRVSREGSTELSQLGATFSVAGVPIKAIDMYSFGVTAYEVRSDSFGCIIRTAHPTQVLVGKPVFGEMSEITATHLMSSGSRPRRPDQKEVSKVVWQVIQSCWDPLASRRMRIDEVVTLLESELGRITAGV